MTPFLLLIPVFVALAVAIRLAAGGMDHGRIRRHIEARGGEAIEVKWAPFGPGWFGEKSDRIYTVRYRDRRGREHQAYCKTSMFTGVYFTQDHFVLSADCSASR